MLHLITAMDDNRLIGKENGLPWRLPADLNYFKKTTLGKTVVMGRKTYDSIGKPLPDRDNVVLTSDATWQKKGVSVAHNVEAILLLAKEKEIFVIGGASVYEQFLPFADTLYITKIKGLFEGDAYFPAYDENLWEEVLYEKGVRDEKNEHDYGFYVYKRK